MTWRLVGDQRARGQVERARRPAARAAATPEARSGRLRLASWALETMSRAVEDRDRAAADHLAAPGGRRVMADHGRGVLVDADAEQLRALGDDHQQPAVAVALGEVLVDHAVREQAEPGGELGHPLLGGRRRRSRTRPCARTGCWPRRTCRRSVTPRRCARRIASPNAVPLTIAESLSWLPPVMKMPVASSSSSTSRRVVGLLAGLGPGADHLARRRACGTARRTPRRPRDRASDAVGITAIRASVPPARSTNCLSTVRRRACPRLRRSRRAARECRRNRGGTSPEAA